MSLPTIQIGDTSYNPLRIFCIGVNYDAHQKEMGKGYADRCVIFMKPITSLTLVGTDVTLPREKGAVHHEVEMVVAIGEGGSHIDAADANRHIAGISVGCDLTLREVQTRLRETAKPWELAKAFEQSALLGDFIAYDAGIDLNDVELMCRINGEVRQHGNTRDMLFKVPTLIEILSNTWHLRPGDLIYTGTPEGVGPLQPGDELSIASSQIGEFSWPVK